MAHSCIRVGTCSIRPRARASRPRARRLRRTPAPLPRLLRRRSSGSLMPPEPVLRFLLNVLLPFEALGRPSSRMLRPKSSLGYRTWIGTLIAEPVPFQAQLLELVDQVPTSGLFEDKRSRLRDMIRQGQMTARIESAVSGIEAEAARARDEIDKGLAQLGTTGRASGDLWSRFACMVAGMGLAVCVATAQVGGAVGAAIAIAANCVD